MYVSYVVYALCLALLIWGGKFAGFKKDQFHDDSTSLDVTKSLRGLAALGVILHHISQEGTFQQAGGRGKLGEMAIFVNAGFLFVSIFFFWSGFGLIKSMNKKENYFDDFLKKRVVKTMLVPFYVNVILYAIYALIRGVKWPVAKWITNFTGLTLMNGYAWYPIVAILLYLAFYFIFKNVKKRGLAYFLMLLVILFMGAWFCVGGHFAWWAGPKNWWLSPGAFQKASWWKQPQTLWFFGEWWVNSAPAFLIGIIFAQYEDEIKTWFKKGYWLKLIAVIILYNAFNMLSGLAQWKMGYWSEYNGQGAGVWNKFVCYFSQIPQVTFFVIMLFVIMMKYHVQNPVTKFFGNISYETYMMNLICIESFRFLITKGYGTPIYKTGHWNLGLYAACVIASSIVLGLLFKWLNKQVNKLIK